MYYVHRVQGTVWRCGGSRFYKVEARELRACSLQSLGPPWHRLNEGFWLRDVGMEDREVGNEGDLF